MINSGAQEAGLAAVLDDVSVSEKIQVPFLRLNELLQYRASASPDAAAVLAPGRAPLSYGGLYRQANAVGRALRAMGIGREDRLAVVLPNGPEAAVAIVGTAANAACAVVNPVYGVDELERYFAALRPHALLAPAKVDAPARRVALAQGVPVIELAAPAGAAAGMFTLRTDRPQAPSRDPVGPGRIALLLLTSGTTLRPKIVELTHANICTSAYSSVAAIGLAATDRCLNVLPLFHGHGLIATVLASLAAGASVVCTPGCDVNQFFGWLKDTRATWYSAVPTMHQAILAQARTHPALAEGCRLRLIRSASAPLPPRVLAELEHTFATAVIEFYGMTETASAPIACNPLPPRRRKAGSVGIPVGLDVAILGDGGNFLPHGQTGEVVVRGPSVTPGYADDPPATQAAFVGEWFKTGDRGFFDDDGYLFLTGRTREMINRGGENIAPREVDEALLEHPAVAEAVTFAVPHATLGEDVAAAIVLRPQADATVHDIRRFAAQRLAGFKVPRRVLVVKELPKGPTGKVQRVGLAAKLGLAGGSAAAQPFVAPRTPLERAVAQIFAAALQLERVGIHDDFFERGGDSLLAAQVLTSIYEAMHVQVEIAGLFDAPTVAEMAVRLERAIEAGRARAPVCTIDRRPRDAAIVTSPAQERLWRLQQALPELPFFNVVYALRVTSPCRPELVARSLHAIVHRHEILRTTFAVGAGSPVQIVAPRLALPVPFDDLRKLGKTKRAAAARRLVRQELSHIFDLAHGPLIRARLVRLAEAEHLLLITVHQTVVDGWSLGVLAGEIAALYEAFAAGKSSPLKPLPLQYADFAAWQRQWRWHPDIAAQRDYWRDKLRGPLPAVSFAPPRRRPVADLRTAQREIALPAAVVEAVKKFSRGEGATLFMALVAALSTLLHRQLGATDLRVATNVANRNQPGTESLIGPCANTLILRTDLAGDPSLREVVRRVRATALAAYANQELPFEDLAATLAREQNIDPAELCQVMILLHNAALRHSASSGKALAFEEAAPDLPMPLVTTTTYDVIFVLREIADGLAGSCIYKPGLFTAKSIDRLFRNFRKVLQTMVNRPEQPISAIRVPLKTK